MIPQLHLLNWGMGVESTAILVRWMLEPQSRSFNDFHNLIVLIAQTGDEIDETKHLCENYLFPLMREHKVRLVQIAKASTSKRDGYIILSDTQQPYEQRWKGEVGGFCITPRKGIFHDETHESYVKKFFGTCLCLKQTVHRREPLY